ncbi:pyrophosphatase [Pantoea phage Phynn]|nr:pyrophosphatase [Pantoea phage Phynn]
MKNNDSLKSLRAANIERQKEWDPGSNLSLSFKGNELAGETGELCNVIKKLERETLGLPGSRDTIEHAGEEMADVIICIDNLATHLGIDLVAALQRKFNATSEKNGLKTRLVIQDA